MKSWTFSWRRAGDGYEIALHVEENGPRRYRVCIGKRSGGAGGFVEIAKKFYSWPVLYQCPQPQVPSPLLLSHSRTVAFASSRYQVRSLTPAALFSIPIHLRAYLPIAQPLLQLGNLKSGTHFHGNQQCISIADRTRICCSRLSSTGGDEDESSRNSLGSRVGRWSSYDFPTTFE